MTAPSSGFNGLGVVVLPPVGYEHSSSFRALHALAQELADRGCLVVRVDPFATGDSAGIASDVQGPKAWQNAVEEGAAYVRRSGAREVLVLGCQIGATLALLAARSIGAASAVALAPVLSGRRYAKEMRMMSLDHEEPEVGMLVGGTEFSASLLDDLARIDVAAAIQSTVPCLVVARSDNPSLESELADSLRADGTDVTLWISEAIEGFLGVSAEEAVIDATFTRELSAWISAWAPGSGDGESIDAEIPNPVPRLSSEGRDRASMPWAQGRVCEQFVTVGPDHLVGVLTTPEGMIEPTGDLVVFLNTASQPHTGPGRAWVEMGRDLALHQVSALRLDMRGWGASPDGPAGRFTPGRAYDLHALEDVRAILEDLSQGGWERVTLAGLCSGAWLALDLARERNFGGVFALNPHLYHQLGDPIFPSFEAARLWIQPTLDQIKRDGIDGRWDREDDAGLRSPAGQWIDSLISNTTPIWMVFSGDDTGLEFLTNRLAQRLRAAEESGRVRMRVIPDLDHSLHRAWLRYRVVDVLLDELKAGSKPGRESAFA